MDGAAGAARFEARGVACVRGGRAVFSDVGFSLASGGALVLAGANGAGKSSLLRIMAGLLAPARGALTWNGAALREDWPAHRRRLHYVGHRDAVKPALTAAENLDFRARVRGAARTAGDALARLGLEALAEVPARFLSAGQRRRLALACLAATPAPLWLLDEPTVALDRESAGRVAAMIAEHRAGGGMAVVATHGEIALTGAHRLDLDRHAGAAASSAARGPAAAEPDGW